MKFENSVVGDSTQAYFRIKNTGVGSLQVSDITSSDPNFKPRTTELTLASNAESRVTIDFRPLSIGRKETVFTVFSNDPA